MGERKEGFQREGWSQLSLTTYNNITFEMDDKRKYFDGVYGVRKGRKKGCVLRLCIHPCNVAVSCSVCGSPCKTGCHGGGRALDALRVFNKRACDGFWADYGSVARNGLGTS
jgi:hypothetical protein